MTTVSRPASLAKIEDTNFDQDLVSVRQEMKRIIDSASKAHEAGEAFALTEHELDWALESINIADAGEHMLAGFKSLMVYLWFEGQKGKPEGEKRGSAWLEGHLNTLAETIRSLRSIGQIRWQCELQGLPLKLFSNAAVRCLKPMVDDPDELRRKYNAIIDGYWKERERVKEIRKVETGRYPTSLPKFITSTHAQKLLEFSEGSQPESCGEASPHAPYDTKKADSNDSADPSLVDQSDDLDDDNDDKIDDLGRVRLRLAEAEEAVEILVRRLPKQRDVGALEAAVHKVAEQARSIELTKVQAASLWRARR